MASLWWKLTTLLLIVAIVIGASESKRPGRKRPRNHPGGKKRPGAGRFPFGLGRGKNMPREPTYNTPEVESKKVFFYSVPEGPTQRPRIILGEELNFTDLGILKQVNSSSGDRNKKMNQETPSISSPQSSSSNNHETRLFGPYDDHDFLFHNTNDLRSRPPKRPRGPPPRSPRRRRPRKRGPGYRLNSNNWENQYVLVDDDGVIPSQNPKKSPKVVDSMKRAAGELVNAYKAAIYQSQKMAKYTSNAATNYFKGVRNLMGGNDEYRKKDNNAQVLRIPEDLDVMKINGDIQEVDIQEIQESMHNPTIASTSGEQVGGTSGLAPNVYLDWGGTFWRLFYNKTPNRRAGQ